MDLQLEGKTALVTGASRGIGKAIAAALLREGCRVVINGRDGDRLEAARRDLGQNVAAVPGDVTRPAECVQLVDACLKEHGSVDVRGLDVLVCSVGSGASVRPGEESPEEWQRVFQLNFFATTNMVEAAREALFRSRGVVVCLSSICGLAALGAPVTYSAAKAALNAYVRGLARPLAERGVRINALAPGNIVFPGSVWEKKQAEDPARVSDMLAREVALHRLGRPEEIADFAVFLASPRSSFATGGVFVVDGGQLRS
jgi:3-oxoacyl-[acyl-carrier protein] reductase